MNRIIGAVAASLLLLAGCTPNEAEIENQLDQNDSATRSTITDGAATPIAGSDIETSALQEDSLTAQQILDQADSPIASRVIYFDYDSARVNDDSMLLLEAHGEFVATNGDVQITLQGHADERGSREYNIALGDRRAQSVRRILLFQGASTDQIDSISYGEEQPAERGHDESAWSKNRRVELLYEVRK